MYDELIHNVREHLSQDALFRYIEKNEWLDGLFDEEFRKSIHEEEYYTTPQTAALVGLEGKDWTIRNLLNKYSLDAYVGMQKIKSRLVLDYIGVIKVKMMLLIMEKTDRKPLAIAEMLGHVASTHVSDGYMQKRERESSTNTDATVTADYSKLYMLAFHKRQLEQDLKLMHNEKNYLEYKESDITTHYEVFSDQMKDTKDSYIREIASLEEQIRTVKHQQLLSEHISHLSKEQANKFSFKKIFKLESARDDPKEKINSELTDQLEKLGEKIGLVRAKISKLEQKQAEIDKKSTEDKTDIVSRRKHLEKEIIELDYNIANAEEKISIEKEDISGDSDMTLFLAEDIDIE